MITIDPKAIPVQKLHQYLLGAIGPRPIAFASTIDQDGNNNLAPFSFFNVFSANPPILIFSPARSGRTNTNKDTFHNVKAIRSGLVTDAACCGIGSERVPVRSAVLPTALAPDRRNCRSETNRRPRGDAW